MSAFAPALTVSVVTPTLSAASARTYFPVNTPMDPVSVAGWATIASLAIAM